MSTKRAQGVESAAPDGADNFKRIGGIGPVVESRLHTAGLLSFTQLATASPAEIYAHLADLSGLSVERIKQQDWIGKAAALAAAEAERPTQLANQPYATFTVQLLFSDKETVRRTKLVHVQSGWEESWAGWDAERLVLAIANQAEIPVERLLLPVPPAPAEHSAPPAPAEHSAPPVIKTAEARLITKEGEGDFLRSGLPYTVAIGFEVAPVGSRAASVEAYVTATARDLSDGKRYTIGTSHAPIEVERQTVTLSGRPLKPGIYRIEVQVATEPKQSGQNSLFRGGLVHVV